MNVVVHSEAYDDMDANAERSWFLEDTFAWHEGHEGGFRRGDRQVNPYGD